QEHATHLRIAPGDAAWVPFGHCVMLVATGDAMTQMVLQPMASESLATALELDVLKAMTDWFEKFQALVGQSRPWDMLPEATEWVRGCADARRALGAMPAVASGAAHVVTAPESGQDAVEAAGAGEEEDEGAGGDGGSPQAVDAD
ncbi:MAG: hypothetical protein GY772_17335, partial [bacterium]|nr:hypothetical protein [bacterium]